MKALAAVFTEFVAPSHMGFMVLETSYWDHPVGRKIFEPIALTLVLRAPASSGAGR
jgi:uncharacterized membrane protein